MTDDRTFRQIAMILEDTDNREAFFDALNDQVSSAVYDDDDTPGHKYYQLTEDYLKASAAVRETMDNVSMAYTGWCVSTLLENALQEYGYIHELPQIEDSVSDTLKAGEKGAALNDLIHAARDQAQRPSSAKLQYDIADTLVTFGDANGGVNNLTVCCTNPIGVGQFVFNDQTIITSGTDGKEAVMQRHEQRLDQLNRQYDLNTPAPSKPDPVQEI